MLKYASMIGAALLLAACATSTPYGPATQAGGYGFSEQRVEENRYRITFRGNSLTSRETVENSILYRAAELTVENGFDYFVVVEGETETRRSYSRSSFYGDPFYGRYGYGYGFHRPYSRFPYYAYGWGWGYPYDSYTREITRYSAVAFVAMFSGEKPDDDPEAFNAREVMDNLGPVVLGDQPAGAGY